MNLILLWFLPLIILDIVCGIMFYEGIDEEDYFYKWFGAHVSTVLIISTSIGIAKLLVFYNAY